MMKELKLKGHPSTIAVMEWIKSHKEEAFNLDHTRLKFTNGCEEFLISRYCTGRTLKEAFFVEDDECFLLDGMKRHYSYPCWWFEIDGSIYYMS